MNVGRRTVVGRGRWRVAPPSRLLSVLLLALFALQSYAVQTHIHLCPPAAIAASAHGAHHPAPLGGDDTCPLCHAILAGGDYLVPTALSMPLPPVASFAAVGWTLALATAGARHPWQSRAPPLRSDL